ncbi:predicted protein, partial [Nematostella vectensis]
QEKEKQLMEKNKDVNETKSKMDVAKSELEIYNSQHKNAQTQLREAHANLESVIQKQTQRKSEIKSIEKELPDLKNNLKKAEADLEKAVQGEAKLVAQGFYTLDSNKFRKLKGKQALNIFFQCRGNVLEALMKQKAAGKIPGLYGRLGDLGAIDDKYDIAISTACGALDHIVCDTMETAQTCVQYLKKNNIGAATFIGLDKV